MDLIDRLAEHSSRRIYRGRFSRGRDESRGVRCRRGIDGGAAGARVSGSDVNIEIFKYQKPLSLQVRGAALKCRIGDEKVTMKSVGE